MCIYIYNVNLHARACNVHIYTPSHMYAYLHVHIQRAHIGIYAHLGMCIFIYRCTRVNHTPIYASMQHANTFGKPCKCEGKHLHAPTYKQTYTYRNSAVWPPKARRSCDCHTCTCTVEITPSLSINFTGTSLVANQSYLLVQVYPTNFSVCLREEIKR